MSDAAALYYSPPPDDAHADGMQSALLEVCRRLKLSMQISGGAQLSSTLLANRWTPSAQVWARLDAAALERTSAEVSRTREACLVELDGATVAFAAISASGSAAAGVVMLAMRRTAAEFPELATIASWIADAFGETSSGRATTEIQRLASLLQILDKAALSHSEREVVRAFAEALSVWTDAECWGYLGELGGGFTLHVSLPGSAATTIPARLDTDIVSEGERFAIVQPRGRDARDGEIILAAVRVVGGSDWLIATSPPEELGRQRFLLYAHVLGMALTSLASVELSRLTWALFDCLTPAPNADRLAEIAEKAVVAVGRVLGAPVSLTVGQDLREPALTAGDTAGNDALLRLNVPVRLDPPWGGVLVVAASPVRPLTKRDEALAASAAHSLGLWLKSAIAQQSLLRQSGADAPLHNAADAVPIVVPESPGMPMIVVSPPVSQVARNKSTWELEHLERWLRPSDVVLRLPSGEFGIRLADTGSEGARAVMARLQRVMNAEGSAGISVSVSFDHMGSAPAVVEGRA